MGCGTAADISLVAAECEAFPTLQGALPQARLDVG